MARSNNEDDIEKAIDKAIAGKMNPEVFKKVMPKSYAALRGNFDRTLSQGLFDQIFTLAQAKLLKDPTIMTQKLRYCTRPSNQAESSSHVLLFKDILVRATIAVGMDPSVPSAPYETKFSVAFRKHVDRRRELFSINKDEDSTSQEDDDESRRMILAIFYEAYRATAYEFRQEIETHHSNKSLDQVCIYIDSRDGFIQDLTKNLEECVTLPSPVNSVHELLEEAANYYRAQAVTNSFVKSVRVIKEIPDFNKCLQCWVCQADETQNCSTCKTAAFCGRKCQRVAWKRNHKVLCPHFQRIRENAQVQCQKIAKVHNQTFIPGSVLLPNQFFDYMMVITSSCKESRRIGEPLLPPDQRPSMDHFYKNIVKVAMDDQAFQALFKKQRDGNNVESGNPYNLALINVCVGLLYNGHRPQPIPGPQVTSSTFLREYSNVNGWTKQSEEMVMASVTEDLWTLFQSEDFQSWPAEMIQMLADEIANPT